MNLQRHISKTASRQKSPCRAFASNGNRSESRAASRVWTRRRAKTASGKSLYNYFRDFDPATGRYIQSDPIGLEAGVSTYGYVLGAPLSASDPHGLLTWSGTFMLRGAGLGKAGGTYGEFDLTSECDMSGKRAVVKVKAFGLNVGIGFPVSETRGTVTLEDWTVRDVRPDLLNGRFRVNSIGIQVPGGGFSGTKIYLGAASSNNVDDSGLDIGFQIGIVRRAKVVSQKIERCACEPENK